jgi:hypothetical protein
LVPRREIQASNVHREVVLEKSWLGWGFVLRVHAEIMGTWPEVAHARFVFVVAVTHAGTL